MRVAGAAVVALSLGRWRCPLGAGGQGAGGFRCPAVRAVPFSQPFVPLPPLLSCNSPILCLISLFKGVFGGFWGACVDLCCFGALRGLWGFCVREWLGGFMACGVFCLRFPLLSSLVLFCPLLCSFRAALVLLSCLACFPAFCLAFLALWLGLLAWLGCLLSFPFGRLQIRKRGAFSASLPAVCVGSFRVLPELQNYCRRFQS